MRLSTVRISPSLINFLGTKLSAAPALSPVSLIFSHFLGNQTPYSEDERLEPLLPWSGRLLGKGIQGKLRVFHGSTEVFSTIYGFIQTSALIPSGYFE